MWLNYVNLYRVAFKVNKNTIAIYFFNFVIGNIIMLLCFTIDVTASNMEGSWSLIYHNLYITVISIILNMYLFPKHASLPICMHTYVPNQQPTRVRMSIQYTNINTTPTYDSNKRLIQQDRPRRTRIKTFMYICRVLFTLSLSIRELYFRLKMATHA